MQPPYPGRGFRALGNEIIQRAVVDDWQGALEKAHEHLALVQAELKHADDAANLLEHWVKTCQQSRERTPACYWRSIEFIGR